jgi:hypothetical protein
MPSRSRPQESKQGLIITLVFFVLATLGLGVAAYYGFAGQAELEKKAAEAKKKEDDFKTDRDAYKFQSMILYSYVGKAEGMEGGDTLGTLKGQFDSGSMKIPSGKDFATKALKDLETKLGWTGNQPKETLEGMINRLTQEKQNLANQNATLDTRLKTKDKELQEKDEELKLAHKEYEDNLKKQVKTFTDDAQKMKDDLAQFRAEVDKLSDVLKSEKEKAEKDKNTQVADLKKREEDIKFLKTRIRDQEDRIAGFEAKSQQAPVSMDTRWKIIRMNDRGLNPYINLGSDDNVKPQLTFSVHGIGLDGRPNPRPKGTLEVINVLGPHLSQTRVTSVKDRNRDPITQGDVIYNGSWNPNLKKHVAIAGIIDLTGDGRDSLHEFMRNLERQNIVVDAYLDTKDGSVKGKITFQTEYLIIGTLPDVGVAGKSEVEKQVALAQKQMQDEAKKYGVQVKGLMAYLELTGYRLPHATRTGQSSLYNPDLRPDHAPRVGGDNPPTPMPDK